VISWLTKDPGRGKLSVTDAGGGTIDAVQALQGECAYADRAAEHDRERQNDFESNADRGDAG
jgi:hypothetical protein